MNTINTKEWKEFRIGDIFEVIPSKGGNTSVFSEGNDIPYVAGSKKNNGFNRYVSLEGVDDWVSRGNCLQFIHTGDAAAGWCNYHSCDFIARNGVSSCAYNKHINKFVGLFLAAVIRKQNKGKYSHKRPWSKDIVLDTNIRLPSTCDGNPDWKYMEQSMQMVFKECSSELKKLQNLGLKRKRINTRTWEEYRIGDLFDIHPTKYYRMNNAELYSIEGPNPVLANSSFNNGVGGYVGLEPTENGGIITFSDTTSGTDTMFYQECPFIGYSHVQGMYPVSGIKLNRLRALFLITAIRASITAEYDFVNKFQRDIVSNSKVMLPSTEQRQIDWSYIEQIMHTQLINASRTLGALESITRDDISQ